jgi:hypothetical protein
MNLSELQNFSRTTYQTLKLKYGPKQLSDTTWSITGLWLWVEGDTKPIKDDLKLAGFKWHATKKCWFYAGIPSRSRGGFSKPEIVEKYGEQRIFA